MLQRTASQHPSRLEVLDFRLWMDGHCPARPVREGSGQGSHRASCPHGETSPGLGASFEQSLCFLEKNLPVSISHKGCSGSARQEESTEMLGCCSPPACLLRVQFYLGQNEDESLGGSISESAEKPPQRGGGRPCRCDLGARAGPCSQADILQKVTPSLMKVTAGYEEPTSLRRILVLF